MRTLMVTAMMLVAAPAAAQDATDSDRTIQVVGHGKASTAPDVASIEYHLAGEGRTADEASSSLVAMRSAIAEQVGGLLQGSATMTDSNLVILAARGPRCQNASGYNAQPRLAEGDCAITGYLATSQGNIRTGNIASAGTAVGLISRLGARDARLQGFLLEDDRAARRAATAQAVADARRQAEAIAAAAGRRLGPLVAIRDQGSGYSEVVVSARRSEASAPPPPPPPAPVEIGVSPRPIETTARVDVKFALLP